MQTNTQPLRVIAESGDNLLIEEWKCHLMIVLKTGYRKNKIIDEN